MNRKLLFSMALFTLFFCCLFVIYNPNIATPYTNEFGNGEIFAPQNGHYDFKTFTINSSKTNHYTAKIITKGHIQLFDDTGKRTINIIGLDKMINSKRDEVNRFLNGELEKPSWSVDGVTVHQIDFITGQPLYSAYFKNSKANTIIYLSTPNEQETADMMNSLKFKEE